MEPKNLTRTCPECGGKEVDGMDCFWQLGGIGQWELDDPELYSLHFYTVAAYNLQHPSQFTEEVLEDLKNIFCEAYDKGWSNEQARARVSKDGKWEGKRKVRLKEPKKPELRQWSMTISDVYIPVQPSGAAERVREWIKVVRNELCPVADG